MIFVNTITDHIMNSDLKQVQHIMFHDIILLQNWENLSLSFYKNKEGRRKKTYKLANVD